MKMPPERNQGLPENPFAPTIERQRESALAFMAELDKRKYPTYPHTIDAVMIFASSDMGYLARMDRTRILKGLEIATVIAANKKARETTRSVSAAKITSGDIANFGPTVVYNGTSKENANFRQFLNSDKNQFPPEKVHIIEKFTPKKITNCHNFPSAFDKGPQIPRSQDQKNTRDQIESLFQQITNRNSPLSNCKEIALVSHIPHFVRIPYYIKKNEDDYREDIDQFPVFWTYAIRPQNPAYSDFVDEELEKLGAYVKRNDLATSPSRYIKIA